MPCATPCRRDPAEGQGRECKCSREASRAALGLHTKNGGETVNTEDAPITTPEAAARSAVVAWLCVLTLIAAAFAAAYFNVRLPT